MLVGAIRASSRAVAATWLPLQPDPSPRPAPPPLAALLVTSTPAGATILVDGLQYGPTPAALELPVGPHAVVVATPDSIPESRDIELAASGAHLDVALWRAQLSVHTLNAALPGAAIANVMFLGDGRVGLVVSLPGDERQAWTLDPALHFAL